MKTSLIALCTILALALSVPALAADQTRPTPNKTTLKKTDHTAQCGTPKECARR